MTPHKVSVVRISDISGNVPFKKTNFVRKFEIFDINHGRRKRKTKKNFSVVKGPWLPVLLEEEDGCSELLIRCANTVA